MTLSAFFGIVGSTVGVVAAGLWAYASCIRWTVGREPGMVPGENGPRKEGFFGKMYFTPNALGPYLNDVSKWNSRAAIATALSMICWAFQTFADLWTRAATH